MCQIKSNYKPFTVLSGVRTTVAGWPLSMLMWMICHASLKRRVSVLEIPEKKSASLRASVCVCLRVSRLS